VDSAAAEVACEWLSVEVSLEKELREFSALDAAAFASEDPCCIRVDVCNAEEGRRDEALPVTMWLSCDDRDARLDAVGGPRSTSP
jgi:hypothetical protein